MTCALALTAAALSLSALVATQAQAALSPVNSVVSATSSDSGLRAAGNTFACPRGDFTGTVSADGRALSGRLAFAGDGRTTCTGFGQAAAVTCQGRITFRSTASTRGTSATFSQNLDSDFRCSWSVLALNCFLTLSGPQTATSSATFNQGTQTLTIDARTLRVTADVPGILCRSSSDGALRGSYSITTGRLTVV